MPIAQNVSTFTRKIGNLTQMRKWQSRLSVFYTNIDPFSNNLSFFFLLGVIFQVTRIGNRSEDLNCF